VIRPLAWSGRNPSCGLSGGPWALSDQTDLVQGRQLSHRLNRSRKQELGGEVQVTYNFEGVNLAALR
jgi:hypothetical protein